MLWRQTVTFQGSKIGIVDYKWLSQVFLELASLGDRSGWDVTCKDLQCTMIGPSCPNCSFVLCTWPMSSTKPSPVDGTPCSGQSVNWNCRTVRHCPSCELTSHISRRGQRRRKHMKTRHAGQMNEEASGARCWYNGYGVGSDVQRFLTME